MTDEQLIERIRSSFTAEVAGFEPPHELLANLRCKLSQGAGSSRVLRRLPVPSLGGVVVVLGACCTLEIAAAFIVLLGHRQAYPPSTTRPPGAGQLVSRLAVLRRPQTAADRSMPPSDLRSLRMNGERPISSLTRLVATFASARTYLIVTPPKYSGEGHAETLLWPASLGDQVSLITVPVVDLGGQPVPAAGLYDPVATTVTSAGTQHSTYFMDVVADGVVRARLVFAHGTVYRAVADNLLIVHNPPWGVTEDIRNITWYGANGQVVSTSRSARARGQAIAFTFAAERACHHRLGRTSIPAWTACLAGYVAVH